MLDFPTWRKVWLWSIAIIAMLAALPSLLSATSVRWPESLPQPMVNLGRPDTLVLADDWTAVTNDKKLSAQFEHSVGVTADGVEIFTPSPAGRFHPTWG